MHNLRVPDIYKPSISVVSAGKCKYIEAQTQKERENYGIASERHGPEALFVLFFRQTLNFYGTLRSGPNAA